MMNHAQEVNTYIKAKHWPQLNSVVVWHNGEIVLENYYNGYDQNSRHVIRSVGKSITSVGAGIAMDQGLISLEDPICRFLPEFREGRDPRHKIIKIKHLLTMTSGINWNGGIHYHCPMLEQMWKSGNVLDYIADCPVKNNPGYIHNYSEFDILLLGAVLDRVTGDCFEFISENLFKPLGIKGDRWFRSKCGVTYSVGDMNEEHEAPSALTALEMVKLGLLFLNGGMYNGTQIISQKYITEAITPSKADPGYGFMWWLGENWYGCRGFGGQTITVFPAKNLVVVTQATPTARPLEYDVMWAIEKMIDTR